MVFDYNGAASPAATIQSLLTASCDGGRWDIGQFRDSTAVASGLTLGWFDDPAMHTVTVMPSYAGDFNLDGVVNDLDLGIWTANFGNGSSSQLGDVNYDGVVNGLDLDLLSQNVGKRRWPATSTPPAETPSRAGTLALLAAALIGLLVCAWRKRK